MKALRGRTATSLFSPGNVLVACVSLGGVAAAAHSLRALAVDRTPSEWLIFAALALLTGSFTIKIP